MVIVRNQSKHLLINAITLLIDKNNYICGYDKRDACYILGHYSSEEKATKVMDMIKEHIENQNNYFENLNIETEYGGTIVTQIMKVFDMPLEEEVEQ